MKKVKITESQYSRVFINEQSIPSFNLPSVGDIFSGVLDYFVDDVGVVPDEGLGNFNWLNDDSDDFIDINSLEDHQLKNLSINKALTFITNPEQSAEEALQTYNKLRFIPGLTAALLNNVHKLPEVIWEKVKKEVIAAWDACVVNEDDRIVIGGVDTHVTHCLMDLLSIIVLIVPPPAGPLISAGLDGLNAASYVLFEDPPQWGNAALTAVGIIPYVGEIGTLFKVPGVSKATLTFFKELMPALFQGGKRVSQEVAEKKMKTLFAKHFKNLSDTDILKYGEEMKNLIKMVEGKIPPMGIKNYYKTMEKLKNLPKYEQKYFKEIFTNEKYLKQLERNGGDIFKTIKNIKSGKWSKEAWGALLNTSLFGAMYIYNDEIGKWLGDKYTKAFKLTGLDPFGFIGRKGNPETTPKEEIEEMLFILKDKIPDYDFSYLDDVINLEKRINNAYIESLGVVSNSSYGEGLSKSVDIKGVYEDTKRVVEGNPNFNMLNKIANSWEDYYNSSKFWYENPDAGNNSNYYSSALMQHSFGLDSLKSVINSYKSVPKPPREDVVAKFLTSDKGATYKAIKAKLENDDDMKPIEINENITEEINRMKSLFTEERLYGNLIKEECDDCDDAITMIANDVGCQQQITSQDWYKKKNIPQIKNNPCLQPGYDMSIIYKNFVGESGLKLKAWEASSGCQLKISSSSEPNDQKFMNLTLLESGEGRVFIAYYKIMERETCKKIVTPSIMQGGGSEVYFQAGKPVGITELSAPYSAGAGLKYIRYAGTWSRTNKNDISTYKLQFHELDQIVNSSGNGLPNTFTIEWPQFLKTTFPSIKDLEIELLNNEIMSIDVSNPDAGCKKISEYISENTSIQTNTNISLVDFVEKIKA